MILLIFYHFCICFLGYWITQQLLKGKKSLLFTLLTSISLGLLISLPLTYLLAEILHSSSHSISYSLIIFCFGNIALILLGRPKNNIHRAFMEGLTTLRQSLKKKNLLIDIVVIIFCLGISSYVMTKTFKEDGFGQLSVARNAVFDFGHGISIIRSMSWGDNIPYTSPFVSETPHIYHFMFSFWAAILEYQGLPISLAINIPSIVSFALFLFVLYELGILLFERRLVGILSIFFMLFHGGLMFLEFFRKFGLSLPAILRNPNYLFAGPFDGSLYSIFFTLNVFVNQRHLGFSLAIFFLLTYLFIIEINKETFTWKKSVCFGIFCGFFILWHLTISIGLFITLLIIVVSYKKWKQLFYFSVPSVVSMFIALFPWMPFLVRTIMGIPKGELAVQSVSYGDKNTLAWVVQFMITNFGFSLLFFLYGFIVKHKIAKKLAPLYFLPVIFFILNVRSGFIDQKYLNVIQILFSFFISAGIVSIWDKKSVGKAITMLLVPFLLLSGLIDFMVIKNDYMYQIPNTKKGELISWIEKNTEKNAVFVSIQNIFDPINLSGRKTYFGFFRQYYILPAGADKYRADIVRAIYAATKSAGLKEKVPQTGSTYMLYPKKPAADTPYEINSEVLLDTYPKVYEDNNSILLKVQ